MRIFVIFSQNRKIGMDASWGFKIEALSTLSYGLNAFFLFKHSSGHLFSKKDEKIRGFPVKAHIINVVYFSASGRC